MSDSFIDCAWERSSSITITSILPFSSANANRLGSDNIGIYNILVHYWSNTFLLLAMWALFILLMQLYGFFLAELQHVLVQYRPDRHACVAKNKICYVCVCAVDGSYLSAADATVFHTNFFIYLVNVHISRQEWNNSSRRNSDSMVIKHSRTKKIHICWVRANRCIFLVSSDNIRAFNIRKYACSIIFPSVVHGCVPVHGMRMVLEWKDSLFPVIYYFSLLLVCMCIVQYVFSHCNRYFL